MIKKGDKICLIGRNNPRWWHNIHRHDNIRRLYRPDTPGLQPQRHHTHHKPLRKPAPVPRRHLLGRHRGGPDPSYRGRILADRLPRGIRTRGKGPRTIRREHNQKLPRKISQRVQNIGHQIRRCPQRPGRTAELYLRNNRTLQGRDAHGKQPYGKCRVRPAGRKPERRTVLRQGRQNPLVPAAGPCSTAAHSTSSRRWPPEVT